MIGDNAGKRCFSASRRSVKDNRRKLIGCDRASQKPALADNVILPDVFVERTRSHTCGQRFAERVSVFEKVGIVRVGHSISILRLCPFAYLKESMLPTAGAEGFQRENASLCWRSEKSERSLIPHYPFSRALPKERIRPYQLLMPCLFAVYALYCRR